jgi:hypothetical protein
LRTEIKEVKFLEDKKMNYEQFLQDLSVETKEMLEYEGMSVREYFELQDVITERLNND